MGFGGVLKTMFPFISAAASLGGPLGSLAANAVGKALNVSKVDATPDGIGSAIAAAQIKDPDALLKLQQAEQEFSATMARLGFENAQHLEEIAAKDRDSARAREISVRDWTPKALAVAVTLGFFALLALLLFRSVPSQSQSLLNVMVGSLGTAWIGIVTYYFGSSAGSARKTEMLLGDKGAAK